MKTFTLSLVEQVRNIALHTFQFFSSLKLALFLLVSLMIVLAAGTFLESFHGAETAKILVYQSPWFSALLFSLAANLIASAFSRYPWKKKHVGFVMTHAGIVLILIGSLQTQWFMIDGQMPIQEGETEHRITVGSPLLYVQSSSSKKDWIVEIKPKPFSWKGRKLLVQDDASPFPLKIYLTEMHPKARMTEELAPSAEGSAALQLKFQSSFVKESLFLIQDDPVHGKTELGPAQISFTGKPLTVPATAQEAKADFLEFQFDQGKFSLPIPGSAKLPATFPLKGTPYQVEILEILRYALVENQRLVDKDPKGVGPAQNPAVRLRIRGKGVDEFHAVFANFPEFPTLHGMKPSGTGAKITYHMPTQQGAVGHALHFFKAADGGFMYQIKDGQKISPPQPVTLNKAVPLGWVDFKFEVFQTYETARLAKRFSPEPNTAAGNNIFPAMQLELEEGGVRTSVWLVQGIREEVATQKGWYGFIYGAKRLPAGFRLELKDFRIKYYPGTKNPESFESDVVLKDDGKGVVKSATISMNEPLIYRGYRIYQSGYNLPENAPEISIFAVGKDAGVPLKYLGTIVMILGTLIMFFSKKYSTRAGKIQL